MTLTVLLTGATGTIGRAAAAALAARGHRVIAPIRRGAAPPPGVEARVCDPLSAASLAAALGPDRPDALLSCIASRSGLDAWQVDRDANLAALALAADRGASRAVLLSAICVQRPRLAFQHAKLEAEAAFAASGLSWCAVRPTAYFKSLSGQLSRVRRGRPYLVFGDGRLTACTPISDRDLAGFLADRVEDDRGGVLPVGGPGPALTPRDQAGLLFAALRVRGRIRPVPPGLLSGAALAFGALGRAVPAAAAKAELARIGHYYATESMLVLDAAGTYRRDLTPSHGADTLADHFAALAAGRALDDRGSHAVF
ncbi:MAG: NAD(P)H-binding protein [Paracoccaceae bacterium]